MSPRIPQQITGQVPLEKTVGPTVGAGFLTDTARAIAQSGSALGQQLGNLITGLKEIEDDTKIRKANVALSTQGIELRNRFTNPVQVAERYGEGKKDHSALASDWSSEWDKAVEGISGNLKGISARRLDQWRTGVAMEKNQEGLTINRFQVGIIRDRAARAFYEGHESINNEFEQGKITTKEEAIARHNTHWAQGVASGTIQDTPANAKARDNYIDQVEQIGQDRQADTIFGVLSGLPAEDALSKLNEMTGIKESVRSRVEARIRNKDFLEQRALVQEREVERFDLYGVLEEGNYAGVIERLEQGTSLTATEAASFRKLAFDYMKAQAKGKLEPFLVSNPQAQLDILRQIDLTPDSVTAADIYDLVGKGLSIQDARLYVTRLKTAQKPGSTTKRPSVKRANTFLEEFKDIRVAAIKTDPELSKAKNKRQKEEQLRQELLFWVNKKDDFENWLQAEPRTDEEINEHLDLITEPVKEELKAHWALRLFRDITDPLAVRVFRRATERARERLAKEQAAVEALPRPKTSAEARELPSGTRFVDTEGNIRIVP